MNARTIVTVAVALVIGLAIWLLIGRRGGPARQQATGGGTAGEVRADWKMASSFPGTLEIIGDGGVIFAEHVTAATDGRVSIRFFDPNKLVPPLEVFDSVSKGAVDAGWGTAGFWIGKLPSAVLFTSVPFGPDTSEYLAWIYEGGGLQIWQELYAQHNIHVEPCALIPPEASGWFRQPITSFDQFNGMKIRFFGLGGKVMQKIGASVQLLAPGDIYPALERGVLDATEFSMPNTDYHFGFHKIAKHYYFPGWHQQASFGEFTVNQERWNAISARDQLIIQMACKTNIVRSIGLGEALQGPALAKFKQEGVQIHSWSDDVLRRLKKVNDEVMAEEAAKDPLFAKGWNSMKAFHESYKEWAQLSRLPRNLGD